MPLLLRIALLCCPPPFRRQYGEQIIADSGGTRWNGSHKLLIVCASIMQAGLAMHVETIARNVVVGSRALAKSRAYTIVAVATLALAIGVNLAASSIVEGVLLKPLGYPHADRLVMLSDNAKVTSMSYKDAQDILAGTTSFEAIGVSTFTGATLSNVHQSTYLGGRAVNAAYFDLFGIRPQIGRLFTPSDLGTLRVILSEHTWRRYFNGNPSVIGHVARLDDADYSIIGVVPDFVQPTLGGFQFAAYWVPVNPQSPQFADRSIRSFVAFGRLYAGVGIAQARADLDRILHVLTRRYPLNFSGFSGGSVESLLESVVGGVERLLWLLLAAVLGVLVIACVNIANLSMVRMAAREREMSTRSALGASRGELMAQLVTETGIIAVGAYLLALPIATAILALFRTFGSSTIPRLNGVHIDASVLIYALLLLAMVIIAIGIVPALTQRTISSTTLKNAYAQRRIGRIRPVLVASEIALAFAVVTSGGLVVRSFMALSSVDLGFDPHSAYAVLASVPGQRYPSTAQRIQLLAKTMKKLHAIPGVSNVAGALVLPFFYSRFYSTSVQRIGDAQSTQTSRYNFVSDEYFRALRIPIRAGRAFDDRDRPNTRPVAIVNEQLARALFGTSDVIGRTFSAPQLRQAWGIDATRTIVGIVTPTLDGHSDGAAPQLYLPTTQTAFGAQFFIRTNTRIPRIDDQVAMALAHADPEMVSAQNQSYDAALASDLQQTRLTLLLFLVLAVVALVLSIAGIYAVVSYAVERRTHEFGVRRAIGASAWKVLALVLRTSLQEAAVGIVIGLGIATLFARSMTSLLFTSPFDPAVFITSAALLVICAIGAALSPAIRATRIGPAVTLRYE